MRNLRIVVALVVVVSASQVVFADCVNTNIVANKVFTYAVCDVPDLDQRRAASMDGTILGLPGDGAMYCVPTSAMNWFAYLGSHSVAPLPEPGAQPQNWETSDPPVYNDMTTNLALLGSMMGTDPANGTGGFAAVAGMQQWLADNGASENFVVSLFYATDDFSPTMSEMAKAALGGAYVMPVIGWYSNADTNDPKMRTGGHIVSLVGASGDLGAATQTMVINDPNNSSTKTTQAAFLRTSIMTQDVTNTFDGTVRTFSRTVGYGSGYIDGYFTIKFNWGLFLNRFGKIVAIRPFVPPGDPVMQVFDTVGPVVDVAIHPQGSAHPYLVEGSNTIWQLDTLTGGSTRFATVGSPRALEFGGADQHLYVLLKNHVIALDREGREKNRILLRDDVDQIAWDKQANELLALSLRSNKLLRFNARLEPMGFRSLPVIEGHGAPSMSVDPGTGMTWIVRRGASSALRIGRGFDVVPLEGVSAAESLSIGESGMLYVSDGGQIVVFDQSGRRLRDSRFAGLPGGPGLELARGFTNFDPAVQTGPGWRNVLPPENVSR